MDDPVRDLLAAAPDARLVNHWDAPLTLHPGNRRRPLPPHVAETIAAGFRRYSEAAAKASGQIWLVGHALRTFARCRKRPFVGWNPRLERVTNG